MIKKILVILILALGWSVSNGQQRTDNPILPRIYENGYTIEQLKDFAKDTTAFSKSYREKLLFIINNGLKKSGEYINVNNGKPLDEAWIDWIYWRVVRVLKDSLPAGYDNTWKNGDKVLSYKSKLAYYGPIDRFIYRSCSIKLDKPSCANLLGYTEIIKIKPKEDFVSTPTWVFKEPKKIVTPNFYPPYMKEDKRETKKEIKIGWITVPIIAIMTTGITHLLIQKYSNDSESSKDTGGRGIDPGPNSGD